MSQTAGGAPGSSSGSPKDQLKRVMGFWDVLLFNIATVLGPRWIAAAAHNGAIFNQPVDHRRGFLFCSHRVCDLRTFYAFSGRGRLVRLVEGSVRRFPRIRRRLDVLDLHRILFSRIADGQRLHERLHRRHQHGGARAKPQFSFVGIVRVCCSSQCFSTSSV